MKYIPEEFYIIDENLKKNWKGFKIVYREADIYYGYFENIDSYTEYYTDLKRALKRYNELKMENKYEKLGLFAVKGK